MQDICSEVPEKLYKYASRDAVRAILNNKSIMFSRPTCYNDDFDLKLNFDFEVDNEAVISAAVEKMWRMLNDPNAVFADNAMGRALQNMRSNYAGGSEEAFNIYMNAGLNENLKNMKTRFATLSDQVAEYSERMKLFCLSSQGTTAPMWGLYAENIKGAVLCFSHQSTDSIFLNAKPVNYVGGELRPIDNTAAIEWLSGSKAIDEYVSPNLFLYSKHVDWQFEREWRVVAGEGWQPDEEREFVEFSKDDLYSVIFGIRTDSAFINEISSLVAQKYPDTKIQKIIRARYGLKYEIVDL